MARQKNPTALFDVIHSAKKPPRPSPSAAIPTPKWWGKNKSLPPLAKSPALESTENVGKQKSWLTTAKRSGLAAPVAAVQPPVVLPEMPETQPAAAPASQPAVEEYFAPLEDELPAVESVPLQPAPALVLQPAVSEPKPRFIDRFKNRTPVKSVEPVIERIEEPAAIEPIALPIAEPIAPEAKPQRPPTRSREERESFMRVDSAAHDIRFRLSYLGLIAIAFIFAMALAIAFLVGTRASQQADDTVPPASDTPPAHTAGMMAAVGPTAPVSNPAPQAGDPGNSDPQTAAIPSAAPVQPEVLSVSSHTSIRPSIAANVSSPAPAPLPIRKTRDIGMLYVVVQSYPEQELAQKACDFMNSAGIPCTLVQGPANWAPSDWYSVVGLQPFNKHDTALPDYEKTVRALGMRFTPRIIDQFQPQAYTWRADSDLSQP